jgi:hypothetical protein
VLANLFLHYAIDSWLEREFPAAGPLTGEHSDLLDLRPSRADTRVVRGQFRGNIDPLAYASSHTWVTAGGTRERM